MQWVYLWIRKTVSLKHTALFPLLALQAALDIFPLKYGGCSDCPWLQKYRRQQFFCLNSAFPGWRAGLQISLTFGHGHLQVSQIACHLGCGPHEL